MGLWWQIADTLDDVVDDAAELDAIDELYDASGWSVLPNLTSSMAAARRAAVGSAGEAIGLAVGLTRIDPEVLRCSVGGFAWPELQSYFGAWRRRAFDQAMSEIPAADRIPYEAWGDLNRSRTAFVRWQAADPIKRGVVLFDDWGDAGEQFRYWARYQSTGRPAELLTASFGPGYRRLLRKVRPPLPPQPSNGFSLLEQRMRKAHLRPTTPQVGPVVDLLTDSAALDAKVLEYLGGVADPAEVATIARRIHTIVGRVAPNGDVGLLDEVTWRRLVGNRNPSPDELIDTMVAGLQLLDDQVALNKVGRLANVDVDVDDLLSVAGIESYFETLITRSGKENGPFFEVRVAAWFLADAGAGRPAQQAMAKRLRLQVPMEDGQDGPDLIVYVGTGAGMVAQIVQMKSFKDLSKLLETSTEGEIAGQILRDIKRIEGHRTPGHVIGPADIPGSPAQVPLAKEIVYFVDLANIRNVVGQSWATLTRQEAFVADFVDETNAHLTLPSTMALTKSRGGTPFQVRLERI
jgi:hypothetical protein